MRRTSLASQVLSTMTSAALMAVAMVIVVPPTSTSLVSRIVKTPVSASKHAWGGMGGSVGDRQYAMEYVLERGDVALEAPAHPTSATSEGSSQRAMADSVADARGCVIAR